MEETKRILGKVVGQEIPSDELKSINGGMVADPCGCPTGYHQTIYSNGEPERCDKD